MKSLNYYYYTSCKCQAPESWHALNRLASAMGDLEITYVNTQTGAARDAIRSMLGPETVAHLPYIGRDNGPLVMVSALDEASLRSVISQALA